jgi:hypothetical protein
MAPPPLGDVVFPLMLTKRKRDGDSAGTTSKHAWEKKNNMRLTMQM